jgi:hypothetical protein
MCWLLIGSALDRLGSLPAGVLVGGNPCEQAQYFRGLRAAVQLDQKSLRDFSGLEQCSQKAPAAP